MVGRITQRLINTNLQFCCSYNLESYYRTYLRLVSVSFLHFQSLLRFINSQSGVTSSFLIKSSFSENQIFHKKWNSYVNFFLVLCLTPFMADITFTTLLLSQIYVCANSYWQFNVPGRKWWHQQKYQDIFKMLVYKCCKTYIQSYYVPSLLEIE